ncbi:SLAP domain-containing protein, partial [Lactobacillus delbrueckii]|uniref:SLAP domain-containing protein n=1 Tax=Lactobacillus delbrueckii TaxID=1584 RepID=UPI001F6063F4
MHSSAVYSKNLKKTTYSVAEGKKILTFGRTTIKNKKYYQTDMTPEIRTLISGVIFMTKYTKEIKLAIYHEWVDDHRRGTYL